MNLDYPINHLNSKYSDFQLYCNINNDEYLIFGRDYKKLDNRYNLIKIKILQN